MDDVQDVRDALGNGHVHPAVARLLLSLHDRLRRVEHPDEQEHTDDSKGGE